MSSWFATKELEPGLWLLSEPVHVNSYLVVGTRRAILFDTGLGIANIRRVVEGVTDLDVLVVNSHYHFDHVGGNVLFDEIAIHEAGVEALQGPVPTEWLAGYLEFANEMLEKFQIFRELDQNFFFLLEPEHMARPLPEEFDRAAWTIAPTIPTQLLRDGDELDIGGRSLQVLHAPGHTPDAICLLDDASGALLAGDVLSTGPIYSQLPDSDVEAFARSTRRLADEFAEPVRTIYPAHFLRFADRAFLEEVADGFESLLAGGLGPRPSKDVKGDIVDEYVFDRFSIVVLPGQLEDGS